MANACVGCWIMSASVCGSTKSGGEGDRDELRGKRPLLEKKEGGRKEGRKRAEGEGKRDEDDLVGKERRKECREIERERERERDARVRTTVVQRANNRYSQVFFFFFTGVKVREMNDEKTGLWKAAKWTKEKRV